jgi:hypothetical protein
VHLVGFIVRNLTQCTVTWMSNHFFNFERCTLHHHFLICCSGTILIHYTGMVHVVWLEPYWYSLMYVTRILFSYIFNNLERNMSAKYVMPYWYGSDIYSMYKYNIIIEHSKFLIQGVQLKSGLYFNMSNLFTNLYLFIPMCYYKQYKIIPSNTSLFCLISDQATCFGTRYHHQALILK